VFFLVECVFNSLLGKYLLDEFQKDLIKFEGDEEAQEEIEYQLASLHCVMVDLAVRKLIEDDFE